ncbi:GAF domain-containing protein [Sphingomonas sinipercae]|uniref:histidine kinase n=1 Tax=Sphingomonas sinipercae TaxID=2714944 RepID=A0A6G7ZKA7_9SPHN|nr:ATP-binding protein [Sphingomonas sinipercae]QIL01359.1 GAF domain-containing protein [Sphingomonas sinipercae]
MTGAGKDVAEDTAAPELLRQETIAAYHLNEEGSDAEFDAVTELAAELFGVPIALVTVLAPDRQLFRGACGLSGGTARDVAFCNHTIEQADVFIVEDASKDPRFASNPLVTGDPFIRFYAGAPIVVSNGVAVGSLCVIDRVPRTFTQSECGRLKMLARTVADLIELRLGSRMAELRKQSLERQTELLRATIDHVQQGIGVFDPQLRLVLWNDLLFDLLKLPREMCEEGCDAERMLMAAARAGTFGDGDAVQLVGELLTSIRTTPSRRLDVHMADGRILDAWRAAISDGRSILAVQDVTEQRRAVKMKDEFVSTVSHELRTPLTSIGGSLAILKKTGADGLDARGLQMLDIATKNVERLGALINDILDMEKIGSGSLSMRCEPLDVRELIIEVSEHTRPFAATHQVGISIQTDAQPLIVLGDRGRLQQAVINLISNACKFSPPGASVRVSARRQGDEALVEVEDDGPGIPVEFRPHIFGRFAQAGPDHQQGRPGSGLGLAITKAIVEKHEGEIGFRTEIDSGSCFWIKLPLRERG